MAKPSDAGSGGSTCPTLVSPCPGTDDPLPTNPSTWSTIASLTSSSASSWVAPARSSFLDPPVGTPSRVPGTKSWTGLSARCPHVYGLTAETLTGLQQYRKMQDVLRPACRLLRPDHVVEIRDGYELPVRLDND